MFNHKLLFFSNKFRSLQWPSSFNNNIIIIQIIVQKGMIKPLDVTRDNNTSLDIIINVHLLVYDKRIKYCLMHGQGALYVT